jgi:hypothetical protein
VQVGATMEARQQAVGNGTYGDLLGLNSNSTSNLNSSTAPVSSTQGVQQPTSYSMPTGYASGMQAVPGPLPSMQSSQQYAPQPQPQFQQHTQYGQQQQMSYPQQASATMMNSANGMNGYQNAGTGIANGYGQPAQNYPMNGMISPNGPMMMAPNANYPQTTSPFPLAATSPYSNLSNPSAGYFGQQQSQSTPQQSQPGYGGMMPNGYGSSPNGMMQMGMNGQGNGMMLPPGWGMGRWKFHAIWCHVLSDMTWGCSCLRDDEELSPKSRSVGGPVT